MGDSEKPNKNNSKSSLDLSDLKVGEEKRKDFIESFTFEECKRIKEIGELYRNKSVKEISSRTDYDIETIKDLVAKYIVLVKNPTDKSTFLAVQYGIEYFGGQKDIEEISDDESIESIKEKIREYVGATLKDKNINDVDLDEEIPEGPVQPESVKKMVKKFKQIPRFNLPPNMLAEMAKSFSIPQEQYNSIYQSIIGKNKLEEMIRSYRTVCCV